MSSRDHHVPCPCGAELADECPKCARLNPLGSMRIERPEPDPFACVCCGKSWPMRPDARVSRGRIHFTCWEEHHSDPTASHDCEAER